MVGSMYTGYPGDALFTGLTTPSTQVPGKFMVGLAGRGFLIDLASNQFRHESIPLLRQQADQSDQPGEASVNPEDLWRRAPSSWHKGAGQRNFDAADSDPARFYTSKGIDVWTEGEFSLLPATDEKKTSANSNLLLTVAGAYLYLSDGTSIQYTQDVTVDSPTWSNITGEPGTAASSMTSDGYTVWSAHGADGIYSTARGGGSTASYATGTVAGVRYVNGRLFAWQDDKLYNVTSGTLPAALLDHPNTDFDWVDVAAANGFYFAAGVSGDKSLIYKTAVKADGTALDVPSVSAELPDGEVIYAIQGYLGFVLIGTDRGVRFGQPNDAGNLTLGALIDIGTPVRCFEPQESFVWFGWSQYDGTSTGLGRMDLSTFNGSRPAYASDLMAAENGNVLSIATFQGIRVFTIAGDGVFAEDTDKVTTGSLEQGRITYGIYDAKVSKVISLSHEPLEGTLTVDLSKDGSSFTALSSASQLGGEVQTLFSTNSTRGETFEIRITLTQGSDPTTGPVIGRVTMRSHPAPAKSRRITVPLILGKAQRDQNGGAIGRPVNDDLTFLDTLESSGDAFAYQEGAMTYTVVLEDHIWIPHHLEQDRSAYSGTYIAQLKQFAEE